MRRNILMFGVLAGVAVAVRSVAAPGDAVAPGSANATATWVSAGITWHFSGDSNHNAAASVEFRRAGTTAWRPALDLLLHELGRTRMLAGSVFRLAPGTPYEFRVTLRDPDGGSAVTNLTAMTQPYPVLPTGRPATVVRGGLPAAEAQAAPGSVLVLRAGRYDGGVLRKSGLPGQWIMYRAAPGEEVVITNRVTLEGQYLWLHNLTLTGPANGVQVRGQGCRITNCRITSHYAIHSGAGCQGCFVADNRLRGDCRAIFGFSGEAVDFGSSRGGSHAVCYNEMTDFADGYSYGGREIDVYNNYIHENVDDSIEPDGNHENFRAWENRCYNSMCGFSFQPMLGGPWYFFNNIHMGAYLHELKVKEVYGPTVFVNNALVSKTSVTGHGAEVLRGIFMNNAWLRTAPGAVAEGGEFQSIPRPTRIDYNAYSCAGQEPFRGCGYRAQAAAQKWDTHSITVDVARLHVDPVRAPAGNPYYPRGEKDHLIPPDWNFDHNLLLPRAGSPLVDAGTVLPNITGPYLGRAPDIGPQEEGLGAPWYGPRTWDEESGLIYGIPAGWRRLPAARAADYASLGCPSVAGGGVLLAGDAPRCYALLRVEAARGEARWTRVQQAVAADTGSLTPVLEFQDGFCMRLYQSGAQARLVVARVEAEGVLLVTAGCAAGDLPAARLALFQFARSLAR